MDDLELAWQTFEFHSERIADLEFNYAELLKRKKILLNKQVPATKWEKLDLKNEMIACCNKLINAYNKHIDSIDDLICLHNEVETVPIERETDIKLFNELKNVSATLCEEMKVYKITISEIFS